MRDDDILGVDPGLHAEAAAHVPDHDPDPVFGHAQHVREGGPSAGRHLAAQSDDQSPIRAVHVGEYRSRLDRRSCETLVDDADPGDVRGCGKRRVGRRGVAVTHFGADVVACFRHQQWRVRCKRSGGLGDGGQFLVIDGDGLECVARLIPCLSNDGSDQVPHESYRLRVQRMAGRGHRRRTVGPREAGDAGHRLHAGGRKVGAGVDRHHARHPSGCFGVHRDEAGMGVRGTQELDHQLPIRAHVVGEPPLSAQEGVVFDAANGDAAAEAGGD